jgi:hypothetical protein
MSNTPELTTLALGEKIPTIDLVQRMRSWRGRLSLPGLVLALGYDPADNHTIQTFRRLAKTYQIATKDREVVDPEVRHRETVVRAAAARTAEVVARASAIARAATMREIAAHHQDLEQARISGRPIPPYDLPTGVWRGSRYG